MGRDSPVQRRALFSARLGSRGVRYAIVSNPKHIFYLTGLPSNLNPYTGKGQRSTSFVAVGSEGECSILLGRSESAALLHGDEANAAGSVSLYTDYDLDATMVSYAADVAREMKRWLRSVARSSEGAPKRVGIEDWHLAAIYQDATSAAFPGARLVGLSQAIMEMRRIKGRDELEKIRKAAHALDFAYGFAKETAREGRTELELFAAMNRASFEKFGVMGLIGGDVVSGERALEMSGAASKRKFRRGDTIIIDNQTAHDNYWCDTARTFVVGRPTAAQEKALETIIEAKDMAARMLVPGTPTREIADAVNKFLQERGHAPLPHHAGHTVGLDDQEMPWLIPGSPEVVRENQAYVIEPGVYSRQFGGMRVEDCYIVTRQGRERVSRFPLEP